jgi:hypothetical protein
MCFILSDLICYETLFQILNIIVEVQKKMNNEKITRRKLNFPMNKTFYFSLWEALKTLKTRTFNHHDFDKTNF